MTCSPTSCGAAAPRWADLARSAEQTVIFADFERSRLRPGPVAEIPVPWDSPLRRQALLMLDDSALAENVVCDVIVDESTLVPAQVAVKTRYVTAWLSRSSGVASSWPLAPRGRTAAPRSGLPWALPTA